MMKRLIAFGIFLNATLVGARLWQESVAEAGPTVSMENGDVNGSGGIDISDVSYLLQWLFTGGPAPVAIAQDRSALTPEQESVLSVLRVANDTLFIEGVNVQIVNGLGSTRTTNGLGNLVVGYNEPDGPSPDRSGSHNIIVGAEHNYTSIGGLVAGQNNRITGRFASISGGLGNVASGDWASISGGVFSFASGNAASVSGGEENNASGQFASISGGRGNVASHNAASVSGGIGNNATETYSSVSGGEGNVASGNAAAVSGGIGNNAAETFSSVSGGAINSASGRAASVSGGRGNVASNNNASISGACNQTTTSDCEHLPQ